MKVVKREDQTVILLDEGEVKTRCLPGAGANTCVWLCVGAEGFECLYYNGDVPSLSGETLRERWQKGLTVAKRDGCEEIGQLGVEH